MNIRIIWFKFSIELAYGNNFNDYDLDFTVTFMNLSGLVKNWIIILTAVIVIFVLKSWRFHVEYKNKNLIPPEI